MNILIYFLLPDFKVVMVFLSYCFSSINDKLVVKCYSTSVVPGFSRNCFLIRRSYSIFIIYLFLFGVKIKGLALYSILIIS
jgi:hypothetical protein